MSDLSAQSFVPSHRVARRRVLKALLWSSLAFLAHGAFRVKETLAAAFGVARRSRRFVCPTEGTASVADAVPVATTSSFSDAELATLAMLIEAIVPTDATPGARETGSAQFVVRTIENYGKPAVAGFKQALAAMDQMAMAQFGEPFAALAAPQRDAFVAAVATNPAFAEFWETVRSLTVFHFYSQPAGYGPIGLPGPNIDRGGYPEADQGREHGCIAL